MAKKKRRSMGKGAGAAASAAKTRASWLKVPRGVKMWKEEEDTTARLDIIPYIVKNPEKHPDGKFIPEDLWFRFPYKVHRNLGPDKRDLVCPRTFGKACYACEERQRIYDDPDGDDDVAKALSASNRILYYVIPKGKKDSSVPHIWDISWFCFGKQLDREIDYGEEEYQNFADLEGGHTLLVRFDKETIGSGSFAKAGRIDFKEREDYSDEDIEDLPDLAECLIIPSNEEVEAAMLGGEVESGSGGKEEDVWEEDEKPKSRKGKDKKESSKKEKPEPEPEPKEEAGKYDHIKKWSELEALDFDELEELNEKAELEIAFEDLEYEEALEEVAGALDIEKPKPKKKKGGKKEEKESKSKKEEKKKEPEKGKCPHGHTFGEDFEEKDECGDCDLADDCFEASL